MNVLLVSIAFPPKSDPESLQVLKYFKWLTKKDVNLSVVTSKNPTLFMDVDENLLQYVKGIEQQIDIRITENKYLNFIKRKINNESLNYPDSKVSFSKSASKVIKELKTLPDIIYSRSFPLSSTLLAKELVRKYNVPWVLHLSDPWTYFLNDSEAITNSEKWNVKMESECIKLASAVCLTSLKTMEFYQKKYPNFANKFHFYPNVYDLVERKEIVFNGKSDNKTITYTGGLTSIRNPSFVLESLQKLQFTYGALKNLTFKFIGPKDRYVDSALSQSGISNLENIGLIPYEKCLRIQEKSDFLLLIDAEAKSDVYTMYFPSKILDYMLTGKPIIAITTSGSTTHEVIEKFGLGYVFNYRNQDEFEEFLLKLDQGKLPDKIKYDLPEEFDASYNVDRLYNLFLQHVK